MTLNSHPKNPNTHGPKQLELYAKIIKYQGFRRAVTISKRSGFVTRGHGMIMSAKIAKWSGVPVEWQDYENEAQEIADLIADNELARWAEIDKTVLKQAISDLDTGEIDMELTGFDIPALENLMTESAAFPEFSEGEGRDNTAPPISDGEGSVASKQVKMFQLFLNTDSYSELQDVISHFKTIFSTENDTDTVMEVLRRAYKANLYSLAPEEGMESVSGEEAAQSTQ